MDKAALTPKNWKPGTLVDFMRLTPLEKEFVVSQTLTLKTLKKFDHEALVEILIFVATFGDTRAFHYAGFNSKKIIKDVKKILLDRLNKG